MKSFTDIEQSKKLAEILPIESADMHYVRKTHDFMGNLVDGKWSHPKYGNPNSKHANYIVQNFESYERIPCWSLAALLGYLNQDWYVNLSHDGICWQCVIDHHDRKERRCSSVLTDEPVDCCVELIVKLKEENLI